jgi:6-phosphogluconate dehydrogenase
LRSADVGKREAQVDAETTPLRNPEHYQYELNLRDVAEVWRRGSVISSWLLDLTATPLLQDPQLAKFEGRVSDSGEGRSRGNAEFINRLLSAMRYEFGGHLEKPAEGSQAA